MQCCRRPTCPRSAPRPKTAMSTISPPTQNCHGYAQHTQDGYQVQVNGVCFQRDGAPVAALHDKAANASKGHPDGTISGHLKKLGWSLDITYQGSNQFTVTLSEQVLSHVSLRACGVQLLKEMAGEARQQTTKKREPSPDTAEVEDPPPKKKERAAKRGRRR
eukprot:TRINITY_DN9499_c0_g3_i5.p2 TRINITY_DN9499_c0_g3~~TRINITY_DN9499_c0_g3_i5.p2  ORF type:complete len:162 (+),score=34.70 TRINITY_DN9499_c0_g3_i5:420-905(+)